MFKVGDIVTGTTQNGYGITNRYSICEVIEIYEKGMWLKLLEHEFLDGHIGREYLVIPEYFELVKPKKINNKEWR